MTQVLVLKNFNGKDPNKFDLGMLKVCSKTHSKANFALFEIDRCLDSFIRAFHGMQVSCSVDLSERKELEEMLSPFREHFKKQYPQLLNIYKKATSGWQRIPKIKAQQDVVLQFNKVAASLNALEMALKLSTDIAKINMNA